ncbi:L-aspartate oxidase [Massilia sp. P8910]|uniref:L-aspartate oxidase n=2 Tax=Massilia TaxID=149698 RepID=A0ABY4A6X5_9BURK|nr:MULTISPECIES: L-aspartate oxidase [Massilia]CUI02744.1 L-aspartate oxidase [Janthinobacterium sp. CG23_2]MCE3608180.1 L-aspartate oxidase [Massilia antarctica]MCY0910163.1 L-aspartate oxidase [Massilia sp. H27-R4]QPI48454.1 L-aspartate oxidase [Massilia antarctica]UOD29291.1 L-aspartate oxidase [Massilia violaceinigra]
MKFDVAIVGSGLAGLSVALHLAQTRTVAIISKRALLDGASNWAQGGIAAVLDSGDSHAQHIDDTLVAGGGLCDEAATRFIVEHGREAIEWLIDQGVPFTRDPTAEMGFHLTREGGHSQRRIIHAADATGHAVQVTLEQKVRAHPNITLFEQHCAIDVITSDKLGPKPAAASAGQPHCYGLYVQDEKTGQVLTFEAEHTVLATGGAGKVYLYTTNPDTATGDGIAMAWRAGCRVSNMEFIQFHPTCLYHPYAKSFLITEAIRGEGGLLKLPPEAGAAAGTRFMPMYDERGELAPRDVVARAIDFEMKKRGLDYVNLDISHQSPEFLKEHFPTIYARCLELGIDITKEPIPVVPAVHFTCGGIVTDLAGRTDVPGLYAVGETACTGLHGANRLASNSLLECLVVGRACAHEIAAMPKGETRDLPAWDESRVTNADEEVVIAHNWDELRRFMWNYVGIVRTTKRLERAQHRIALLKEEIDEYYRNFRITHDLLELRNLVDVASLIVNSALTRRESRGLHFSRDYPNTLPKALPSVLTPPRR